MTLRQSHDDGTVGRRLLRVAQHSQLKSSRSIACETPRSTITCEAQWPPRIESPHVRMNASREEENSGPNLHVFGSKQPACLQCQEGPNFFQL